MATADSLLITNLKEILRTKVKLEGESENVRILQENISLLIEKMKSVSKLFSIIYNRIYYTGSYYEGLRVKNATEFDLNIVLAFPKNMELEIRTTSSPPSFATSKLKNKDRSIRESNKDIIIEIINKFFDERDYFIPDKIKNWFQSVIDRALSSLRPSDDVKKIQKSGGGPARTIIITTKNGTQLNVDLVPVLEFKYPVWPDGADKSVLNRVPNEEKYWFIVPKQPPPDLCNSCQNYSYQWRLHFPGIEKYLIHNKGCVKPIIKLLKLLRDEQKWKILASYYLKTVVIHAVIENKIDWNENKMGKTFIEMLKKLLCYIEVKFLPYVFYKKYNLICKMNELQKDNIEGRLKKIIKDIESNPERVNKYM